jgi:hypothetical protein
MQLDLDALLKVARAANDDDLSEQQFMFVMGDFEQTFSPEVVIALIERLQEAEKLNQEYSRILTERLPYHD